MVASLACEHLLQDFRRIRFGYSLTKQKAGSEHRDGQLFEKNGLIGRIAGCVEVAEADTHQTEPLPCI